MTSSSNKSWCTCIYCYFSPCSKQKSIFYELNFAFINNLQVISNSISLHYSMYRMCALRSGQLHRVIALSKTNKKLFGEGESGNQLFGHKRVSEFFGAIY